jgi:hypothetical protein
MAAVAWILQGLMPDRQQSKSSAFTSGRKYPCRE